MNRGDVVYVDWPHSDRTGSKPRPAVVVQADFLNTLIADTVLVLITRKHRAAGQTEVVLDPAVETRSGLYVLSVASATNYLTLDQSLILRKVGEVSAAAMAEVEQAMRVALDIP
jgi:mRNA-degrading endonuclease toxin of MazEF toxin-antitoxin module